MACLHTLSPFDAWSGLQDLAPLSTLPKLRMLSLLGNPVTTKPNYRCARTANSRRIGGRALGAQGLVCNNVQAKTLHGLYLA